MARSIIRTIAACFLFLMPLLCGASPLVYTDAGAITRLGSQVALSKQSGEIDITTPQGDVYNASLALIPVGVQGFWNASNLPDAKVAVDSSTKTTSYSATFSAQSGGKNELEPAVPFTYSMQLLPNGLVRCTVVFNTPDPVQKHLGLSDVFLRISRDSVVGSQVVVDGRSTTVPAREDGDQIGRFTPKNDAHDITFFPTDPERTLSFYIVQAQSVSVNDLDKGDTLAVETRMQPLNNRIVFDIALPEKGQSDAAETIGGINYAPNQGQMPQYALSRNLIQNPGFENGLQYWMFGFRNSSMNTTPVHADDSAITTVKPFAGHRCVELLGEPGQTPFGLSTMAIPVTVGKSYTLSFYAKSDIDGRSITSEAIGYRDGNVLYAGDLLHTDWRRYSHTFTSKAAIINVCFQFGSVPADAAVYIDNVQLEEGPLTDFTQKPFDLVLATNSRNNLSQPGQKIGAHWDIHGLPSARGTVAITTRNIFGQELSKHNIHFTTNAVGDASVAEPWCEGAGKGLYIQEADLQSASGFKVSEFGRISIMKFITQHTEHQSMFSLGAIHWQQGSWDRKLSSYRNYGLGSSVPFGLPTEVWAAKLKQYGLEGGASPLAGGESLGTTWVHSGPTNFKHDWTGDASQLPAIEQFAYDQAKSVPDQTLWKTVNEPANNADDVPVMKRLMNIYSSLYNGIKKAQPNSIVYSPDPSNISPSGGTKWLQTFIENGGLKACDQIAGHNYRPRPESPDLDSDINTLLTMLDQHGYHGNVWFTEGGGWEDVDLPAIGMNVHTALSSEGAFGDWASGYLTYDMTFGEKMASAYTMRNWLICLKYGSRVKQASDWLLDGRMGVDYDETPTTECFVVNTLDSLLGNATYARTIPMGDSARCYAFLNEKHEPVIALWTTDLADEAGPVTGPILHLGSLANEVRVINMVGSKIAPSANGGVQMSAYPTFIVGKPGSLDHLSNAILNAASAAIGTKSLVGYAQRVSSSSVTYSIRNTFGTPIDGMLSAGLGAQKIHKQITIAPGKTQSIVVSTTPVQPGMHIENAGFDWTPKGSVKSIPFPAHIESIYCPRVSSPIDITGDLANWPIQGVVPVPAQIVKFNPPSELNRKYPTGQAWDGPNDLSATFYLAYDANTLYLAYKVKDNVFSPAPDVNSAWSGDGIQIYFDPWLTGHAKLGTDWPSDDQVFDVWPGPEGIVVNREVTPDHQIAFLDPGAASAVKSHFTKTAEGYTIALAIPIRQLAPLELKPGGVFNFAFFINDNDGEYRKQGLALMPSDIEPFQNWAFWPTVVLGK